RLLTVNMFMRPPGIRSHSSDYKDERLEYFIDHVLPNYDVITLQEMFSFMTTRRQRLIRAAEELGFHYWVTSPAPPLWGLSIDGGLAILSRYPIVDMDSIRYDRGEYSDWLAAKGALYAKIALNPKTHIHIFTTHTQASYGKVTPIDAPSVQIRFRQFADLHRFMRAKTADRLPGEPVIVQGDFNVDARVHEPDQEEDLKEARSTPEYLEMLNIFRGKTPEETSFLLSEDLVYQQWRYHPVTFADVKELPDGRRIARDRILTDDQLHGSCQRLDYVFW
ncbi:Endonuclease/exonuclease/phosphatase, partial [Dimargaris cristalligena]